MRAVLCALLLASSSLVSSLANAAELHWQLAREQDGVRVYLAQVQGSRYQAYRGVTRMRTDMVRLLALQEDVVASCAWVYACEQQRLLASEGEFDWLYTRLHTPWPVAGRDSILRVQTHFAADGSVMRQLQGVPDYLPEQPRLVRVSKFEGFWQMRPLGEGQVEVIYQAHTEPGGSLPAWLANSFVVDVPLHTLLALRRLAEQP
jgi:hypothetical protein